MTVRASIYLGKGDAALDSRVVTVWAVDSSPPDFITTTSVAGTEEVVELVLPLARRLEIRLVDTFDGAALRPSSLFVNLSDLAQSGQPRLLGVEDLSSSSASSGSSISTSSASTSSSSSSSSSGSSISTSSSSISTSSSSYSLSSSSSASSTSSSTSSSSQSESSSSSTSSSSSSSFADGA